LYFRTWVSFILSCLFSVVFSFSLFWFRSTFSVFVFFVLFISGHYWHFGFFYLSFVVPSFVFACTSVHSTWLFFCDSILFVCLCLSFVFFVQIFVLLHFLDSFLYFSFMLSLSLFVMCAASSFVKFLLFFQTSCFIWATLACIFCLGLNFVHLFFLAGIQLWPYRLSSQGRASLAELLLFFISSLVYRCTIFLSSFIYLVFVLSVSV
jgi:hypothetical protein